MVHTKIAALQMGSSPEGKAATLARILAYEAAFKSSEAKLIVMPEALIGGYPKGESFGARVGYRTSEGRRAFGRYYENAIDADGEEARQLAGLSTRLGVSLVVGVVERAGATLYCSAFFFDPEAGLVARHRKLMPTASERLIWGQGDGSTLPVVNTAAGRAGAAICWENYMPLLRTAMYAKGVDIWCAPTVDERDVWQSTMRHIALEGRCFVISACQVQASPAVLGVEAAGWERERPLIRGGSVIIGPLGEILAGPLLDEEGLVVAEAERSALAQARFDFDVVGHYARPDIFHLRVDETRRAGVEFESGEQSG